MTPPPLSILVTLAIMCCDSPTTVERDDFFDRPVLSGFVDSESVAVLKASVSFDMCVNAPDLHMVCFGGDGLPWGLYMYIALGWASYEAS